MSSTARPSTDSFARLNVILRLDLQRVTNTRIVPDNRVMSIDLENQADRRPSRKIRASHPRRGFNPPPWFW
jgi:hypothetical protein